VEKGSLSVALWMAIAPLKAKAQTNDPPPSGSCYVFSPSSSSVVEYSRRGMIVWEITPTSATDYDFTPWGLEENFVVIVGWTDFMEGEDRGEFGYSPDGYSFYPVNNPEWVNAYRPKPGFVGVLRIAPILDDIPIGIYSGMPTYDDDPVTGEPWKMTIWEFWITPCPYNWRPMPNATGPSFTAWIEPEVDHLGQSMGRFIAFELFPSTESGECLNSHFLCPYDVDGVFDGIELHGIHDNDADLQFPPYLEGMYVYGQWEEDEEGPYVHNFTFAVTQQPTTIATVGTIFCFDGGAYEVLLAYTNMPEGIVFARRTDTGLIEPVEIPYDENGNFIADVWEWNMGIYPADALGDFDNYPVGDGTPGDGLSVYEEYRGLMVRYLWTVFNPWIKDMFVMNFGAGNENPYQPAVIPNDAITDAKGFPGAGMPLLWLLNANEGETVYQVRQYRDAQGNIHNILLTGKRVNYLHGYAHLRDVYSAVVVPGTQLLGQNSLAETFGPIWDVDGLPVIEINARAVGASVNGWNSVGYNYDLLHALACVIAHELGHTILWDVDHNPTVQDGQDPISVLTNGDSGHHVYQQHRMHCFMWPYFPPGYVPDLNGDGNPESLPFPNLPTDFCDSHPGCQSLWHLNPK
jgi:hypothetical protein